MGVKGEWGKEERKPSPYKEGDNVDIRIRAHDNKFEVSILKEKRDSDHKGYPNVIRQNVQLIKLTSYLVVRIISFVFPP